MAFFPEAKGDPSPHANFPSFFERIYAFGSKPSPPASKLIWFHRVLTALQEADARLLSIVEDKKEYTALLPPHKSLYAVARNLSKGRAVPLNKSIKASLNKVPQSSRFSGISLRELASLSLPS